MDSLASFGFVAGLVQGDDQVREHPEFRRFSFAPVGHPLTDLLAIAQAHQRIADLAPGPIFFTQPACVLAQAQPEHQPAKVG